MSINVQKKKKLYVFFVSFGFILLYKKIFSTNLIFGESKFVTIQKDLLFSLASSFHELL